MKKNLIKLCLKRIHFLFGYKLYILEYIYTSLKSLYDVKTFDKMCCSNLLCFEKLSQIVVWFLLFLGKIVLVV